ncbi:hypothetical protein SAMN05216429_101287 [Marinobacter persicus]|uniref:Uncharacterized protein n=1 Tax=Marinobacter persicus TaxID=930118 RepID=A0A1I3PRW9_9GAMM|nr:hypothetical protein SAMN05216429_101287 [Marinobacter persicus]
MTQDLRSRVGFLRRMRKPDTKPAKFYTVGAHKKTGMPKHSGFGVTLTANQLAPAGLFRNFMKSLSESITMMSSLPEKVVW